MIIVFQIGDGARVTKNITSYRRRPETVAALLAEAGLEPVLPVYRCGITLTFRANPLRPR